VQLKQSIVEQS
jgi:hypothetical protein